MGIFLNRSIADRLGDARESSIGRLEGTKTECDSDWKQACRWSGKSASVSQCSGCGSALEDATPTPVSWTVLAATRPLLFVESPYEYAVFDERPATGGGLRRRKAINSASQTYGAHGQSLAHGVAYTAVAYRTRPPWSSDRTGAEVEDLCRAAEFRGEHPAPYRLSHQWHRQER